MADNIDLNIRVGMQDAATRQLKGFESSVIRTVGAISAAFASIKAIAFPLTQSARFERNMADVAKTTGYTDREVARLSDSLVDLSKELGVAANDLANVAAIAGQLGLGTEGRKAVEAFTGSVARASVTLGIAVEQTAEGGAQLSAIFGKSVGEVEKVFSTINELSNNSVAAGADLIDIMKRVGTTSQATFEQVAALAATMRQLGVPNEQAGTALVKFLGNLLAESKKFAAAMGTSQSAWVQQVQKDSVGALKEVLKVLSEMEAAEAAALTKELFGSGRLYSAASKLIQDAGNDFAVLDEMVRTSNKGFDEGTSSLKEYEKIMDTVVSQTEVFKASFTGLAIEVGKQSLGLLKDNIMALSETLKDPEVIAYFTELGKGLSRFIGSLAETIRWVAALDVEWTYLGTAIKVFLQYKVAKVLLGWAAGFSKIIVPIRSFVGIIGKIVTGLFSMGNALRATVAGAGAAGLGGVLGALFAGASTQASKATKAITGTVKSVGLLSLAFKGLGRAVSAAFGPIGIGVFLAVESLFFWKDEILEFLGFVNREKIEAERKRKALERASVKAKADAISDYEEFQTQIDKLIAETGELRGAEREIGYEVYLDTDAAIEDLKELIDGFNLMNETIKSASPAITIAEQDLDKYSKEALKAQRSVEFFTSQIALLKEQFLTGRIKYNPFEDGSIEELTKKLKQAEAQYASSTLRIDEATKSLDDYWQSLGDASNALESFFSPEILSRFDQQTAAYARLTALISQNTTKLEERKKVLEDLNKIAVAPEGPGLTEEQTAQYQAIVKEIAKVNAETSKWSSMQEEVYNGLSVNQQQVANIVRSMGATEVQQFASAIQDLDFKQGDQVAASMRTISSEVLFNYIKLRDLKKQYDLVGDAAEAYAERAKSVFDNTANEIIALSRKLANFAVDFKNSFKEIRIDIALDTKLDNIDDEYQERISEVEEFYDKRIAIADESTAKYLENKKKEKLADLENQQIRETADAKAKSLQEQFNLFLERSTNLMSEANKEAGKGNFDKALALKGASKSSLDQALDVMNQMQSLQTVNIFDKTDFKFSEGQLNDMLTKVQSTGNELGGGIKEVNDTLNTTAAEVAEKWKQVVAGIGSEFSKVSGVVDKMRLTFSNFDEILTKAEGAFDSSASSLREAADIFSTAANNPFDAAKAVDPGKLAATLKLASEEGFSDFSQLVGAKFALGLQEGTSELSAAITPSLDTSQFEYLIQQGMDDVEAAGAARVDAEVIIDPTKVEDEIADLVAEIPQIKIKEAEIEKFLYKGSPISIPGLGYARGGPVNGPGSGTSDSIPAWLSNGEFVMDAFTTRFFGSGFFSALQGMARGGRRAPSMKGGMPAFANGGAVSGASNVGSITLNLGGRAYTLYGEKSEAEELVSVFKSLDRS